MPSSIEKVLEETLKAWEDMRCIQEGHLRFLHRTVHPIQQEAIEAIARWRTYRKVLMDNAVTRLEFNEWFVELRDEFERMWNFGGLNSLKMFPFEFFMFSRKSRRVISINAEMQSQFEMATFPEWRWEEILWPFESFAIELARPVVVPLTKRIAFSCTQLLISRIWFGDQWSIFVRAFDGEGKPSLLRKRERLRLVEAMKNNNMHAIFEITEAAVERREGRYWRCQGSLPFCLMDSRYHKPTDIIKIDDRITGTANADPHMPENVLRNATRDAREAMQKIIRIVLGTCVYLDSVSHVGQLRWENRRTRDIRYVGPLGIITNESHVCRIIGRGSMDPSAFESPITQEPNSRASARPHWRRRHRRRPPNTPASHPRTIVIPPTFINEALVPYFGLIAGSITTVLPED